MCLQGARNPLPVCSTAVEAATGTSCRISHQSDPECVFNQAASAPYPEGPQAPPQVIVTVQRARGAEGGGVTFHKGPLALRAEPPNVCPGVSGVSGSWLRPRRRAGLELVDRGSGRRVASCPQAAPSPADVSLRDKCETNTATSIYVSASGRDLIGLGGSLGRRAGRCQARRSIGARCGEVGRGAVGASPSEGPACPPGSLSWAPATHRGCVLPVPSPCQPLLLL